VYPVLDGRGDEDVDCGDEDVNRGDEDVNRGDEDVNRGDGDDVDRGAALPLAIGTIPMPPRLGGTKVAKADCIDDFVEQKSATAMSGPRS